MQYFQKNELKKALRDITEPLTGSRADLAKRVYKEWSEHGRTLYDLLDFLPKSVLSDICYDFSLDHKGSKETLKRRIVKAIEKNNLEKNQQIESKDFPEEIARTSSHHQKSPNRLRIVIGLVVAAIVVISTIGANFATISDYLEKRFTETTGVDTEQNPNNPDPYQMSSLEQQYSDFELNLTYKVNSPNVRYGNGGVLYDAFVSNNGKYHTYTKTFWIVVQECDENGNVVNVVDSIENSDERLLSKADPRQGLQLEIAKMYPGLEKKRTFNLEFRTGGYPYQSVPLPSRTEFKTTYIQFDYNNDTDSWHPHINNDFILDCTLPPSRNSGIVLDTLNDKQWAR